MHKIAVVSDSHVPDNQNELNPNLITSLENYSPELIIHAGDFITYGVKKQFEKIAPVIGVRGNRDLFMPSLPNKIFLNIDEIKIGVIHGHGTFWAYVAERMKMVVRGPRRFSYYENLVKESLTNADILIHGHSHKPLMRWEKNQLLFNPGSTSFVNKFYPHLRTSFGILEIERTQIKGKIIFFDEHPILF